MICVCFGFHRLLLSFFAIHCWHHPLWGLYLIIHLCVIFKALTWSRLCTVHPHLAWKCPLCISCGFIYLNLCLCSLSMLCCCCCISLCCSNLLCACFELRLRTVSCGEFVSYLVWSNSAVVCTATECAFKGCSGSIGLLKMMTWKQVKILSFSKLCCAMISGREWSCCWGEWVCVITQLVWLWWYRSGIFPFATKTL